MHWKFYSLILSEETRFLWDICLQDISLVNGLETFCIGIKIIELAKK